VTVGESSSEAWTWADLFQLQLPAEIAVSDREHAAEFVPRRRVTPDTAAPRPDEREAARAWLSVFGPEPDSATDALVGGITRFAATVGRSLSPADITVAEAEGLTWGRADFTGTAGDAWQAVGIAWNGLLALFIIVASDTDPDFTTAMDSLLASFRALDAVLPANVPPETDGDF